MSSSEVTPRRGLAPALLLLLAACVAASGCTVRPLYGDVSSSIAPAGQPAGLGAIGVRPVTTRYAQEVRNHLIFAFNGGAGEPASPRYLVTLNVGSAIQQMASVQIAADNEPTAGTVTMTGSYSLTDTQSGEIVARGRRIVTSSFDRPLQEFASLRAQRDAENRAARELAEFLRLAVAQDLEDLPG